MLRDACAEHGIDRPPHVRSKVQQSLTQCVQLDSPRAASTDRGEGMLEKIAISHKWFSFSLSASCWICNAPRASTTWPLNDLGGWSIASLMAVCKSRSLMAFPSTHSQQPSTSCHNSHYAPLAQQETQPDKPIGYGAFGVVWCVFRKIIVWGKWDFEAFF